MPPVSSRGIMPTVISCKEPNQARVQEHPGWHHHSRFDRRGSRKHRFVHSHGPSEIRKVVGIAPWPRRDVEMSAVLVSAKRSETLRGHLVAEIDEWNELSPPNVLDMALEVARVPDRQPHLTVVCGHRLAFLINHWNGGLQTNDVALTNQAALNRPQVPEARIKFFRRDQISDDARKILSVVDGWPSSFRRGDQGVTDDAEGASLPFEQPGLQRDCQRAIRPPGRLEYVQERAYTCSRRSTGRLDQGSPRGRRYPHQEVRWAQGPREAVSPRFP